jgi:MHS family proline/betaine transporter-like MFS transporter
MSLTKGQFRVISVVTFGNILEWFEIYLYAYWAPIISTLFFNFDNYLPNLISTFIVFGAGFLARPFGAILFGRLGDLIGRKQSFTLSITVMTIPTFLMGLLPTYAQIGVWAPILMALMRLLQAIPAAGEAPGAFCYLYENASASNKKFMTSWGAFGNQIGAILSVIECFLMKQYLPQEFLVSWGWRISFWTGGLIGLLGIYLRYKLDETPQYKELVEHHRIRKETIKKVISDHKKGLLLGTGFGVINAATFYLIASYIPTYFNYMLGLSTLQNALITLTILLLTTILLPVFGMIGDRYNNKTILVSCAAAIIVLLYPLCTSINSLNLWSLALLCLLFLIPITCITALLPYLLANLFPTRVRFTCVGLTFNIVDGIVGGFTPAIALFLLQATSNQGAFCWYILACAVISLISYFKIKS